MNFYDTASSIFLYTFVIYSQVNLTETTILHTDNTTWFRSINKRTFPDLGRETLNFSVKACYDIRISITENCLTFSPRYVIIIGSNYNQVSKIRMCNSICAVPIGSKIYTPQILSCNEFRSFWLAWGNGNFTFGTGEVDQKEIIHTERRTPMTVNYIGIRSLLPVDWIISDDIIENSSSFDEGTSCPQGTHSTFATSDITTTSETSVTDYTTTTNVATESSVPNLTDTTSVATETAVPDYTDTTNVASKTPAPNYTDTTNVTTETSVPNYTDATNLATETSVPNYTDTTHTATETSVPDYTDTTNVVTETSVSNYTDATNVATETSVLNYTDTTNAGTLYMSEVSTIQMNAITDNFSVTDDTTMSFTCSCSCEYKHWTTRNVSQNQLQLFLKDRLKEINENIKISKDKTTAYKSTKLSATDNRNSSAVIGWLGSCIICIPFVLAIVSDLLSIKSK